jgi:hypothetical protein
MILRRMTMVLVAAVAFSPLAVPVAEAVDLIKDAVVSGAARLVFLQNADGGWCFTVPEYPGCASASNTFGVTAQGLLAAHLLTPTPALLTAAKKSGDNLKARGAVCGFDTGGGDTPMRTSDVVFLQDLGQVSGNATYKTAANAFFNCVVSEFPGGGSARANNRIDRRQLGAWDAAFDIRAALRTGTPSNKAFALAELTQVLTREADWSGCGGCNVVDGLLGKAQLLLAMVPVQNASPLIKSKVIQYLNDLVAVQAADGSWGDPDGSTQLTAYAILGIDPYASTTALKLVVKNAADFLLSQQIPGAVPNPGGGFDNGRGTENTEVDSEVLQALNAAH